LLNANIERKVGDELFIAKHPTKFRNEIQRLMQENAEIVRVREFKIGENVART
jgi:hypothetical protein